MQVIKSFPHHSYKYITCFYSIIANEEVGSKELHRRLPDGTLDLVLNLGSVIIQGRTENELEEISTASITGLHQQKNFIRYSGSVHLIGVVFKPGFAHLFMNDSLDQFRECNFSADLIFGNSVHRLVDELQAPTDEIERHYLLERFLMKRIRSDKDWFKSEAISSAISILNLNKGNMDIAALCRISCMSERNFRRLFNQYVGMSPKEYATIIRIKSFSKIYEKSKSSINAICYESGYADQSHLHKDFQRIVGISPGRYFGELNEIEQQFLHLI